MPYETSNATDILETLFWLETLGIIDLFKMNTENEPDQDWVFKGSYNDYNYINYNAPIGIAVKYNLVNEFMQEWYQRYTEFHNEEITKKQYMNWKLNWPRSCDNAGDYIDWRNLN